MIYRLLQLLENHGAFWQDADEHVSKIGLERPVIRHSFTFGPVRKNEVADALSCFGEAIARLAIESGATVESQGRKTTYSGAGFKVVINPASVEGGSTGPYQVKLYLERALAEEHLAEKSKPVLKRIDQLAQERQKNDVSARRAHQDGIRLSGGKMDWRRRL